MKADVVEIHFIAGQLFTVGVAFLAVGPRMPFDSTNKSYIGGNLSYPFRRALLGLVVLGFTRIFICHILFSKSTTNNTIRIIDELFDTIHVIGQSFLCLTTAYLLERQLSTVINILPGASLFQIFVVVVMLTPLGIMLAYMTGNTKFQALSHVAEAISCYGVLNTLKIYSSVMSPPSSSDSGGAAPRGPFMTQLVQLTEYWFLSTSLLSIAGEMITLATDKDDYPSIAIFLKAIEYNQDSGIDDWTRLLVHSIFLNSLDEMQHFMPAGGTRGAGPATTTNDNDNGNYDAERDGLDVVITARDTSKLRPRGRHH